MPNKLVGVAEMWMDEKGAYVPHVQFPVVCSEMINSVVGVESNAT